MINQSSWLQKSVSAASITQRIYRPSSVTQHLSMNRYDQKT